MALKTIHNTSLVAEAVCLHVGRQLVLGPDQEAVYETEIADAFLAQCPTVAPVERKIGDEFAQGDDGDTVYLANMTGDPDAPAEIFVSAYDKLMGRPRKLAIENPKKLPQVIKRYLEGGQSEVPSQTGPWGRNHSGKMQTLPPYGVKPFPRHIAKWMLMRDGQQGVEKGGCIVRARKKPHFVPDENWPLNETVDWLELHDYKLVGKLEREEDIRARCTDESGEFHSEAFRRELAQAIELNLKRAYFRWAPEENRLYSKTELAEFQRARAKERELDKLAKKKKPGVPAQPTV